MKSIEISFLVGRILQFVVDQIQGEISPLLFGICCSQIPKFPLANPRGFADLKIVKQRT